MKDKKKLHKAFESLSWCSFDIGCLVDNRFIISSRITVAILFTPLENVLNVALNIQDIKRPVKPGNHPKVSITNNGYI